MIAELGFLTDVWSCTPPAVVPRGLVSPALMMIWLGNAASKSRALDCSLALVAVLFSFVALGSQPTWLRDY